MSRSWKRESTSADEISEPERSPVKGESSPPSTRAKEEPLAFGDYLVVACSMSQARLTRSVSSPNAKAMGLEFELRLEGMFGEEAGNF